MKHSQLPNENSIPCQLWKSTSNNRICFWRKMVNFGVSSFVNFVRSRKG
ncbi:hypothetical protein RDI58_001699 [Solanum bulbocastanum]|uniref:Uncharacterized protein n=1 Tax=Solanum bulbocastanum TaxID=147425 RepID=A0AAN8UC89_SOLBU